MMRNCGRNSPNRYGTDSRLAQVPFQHYADYPGSLVSLVLKEYFGLASEFLQLLTLGVAGKDHLNLLGHISLSGNYHSCLFNN